MSMTPEKLVAWRDIATNTNPCVPEGGPSAELEAAKREAAEWRSIAQGAIGQSAIEAIAEYKGLGL